MAKELRRLGVKGILITAGGRGICGLGARQRERNGHGRWCDDVLIEDVSLGLGLGAD